MERSRSIKRELGEESSERSYSPSRDEKKVSLNPRPGAPSRYRSKVAAKTKHTGPSKDYCESLFSHESDGEKKYEPSTSPAYHPPEAYHPPTTVKREPQSSPHDYGYEDHGGAMEVDEGDSAMSRADSYQKAAYRPVKKLHGKTVPVETLLDEAKWNPHSLVMGLNTELPENVRAGRPVMVQMTAFEGPNQGKWKDQAFADAIRKQIDADFKKRHPPRVEVGTSPFPAQMYGGGGADGPGAQCEETRGRETPYDETQERREEPHEHRDHVQQGGRDAVPREEVPMEPAGDETRAPPATTVVPVVQQTENERNMNIHGTMTVGMNSTFAYQWRHGEPELLGYGHANVHGTGGANTGGPGRNRRHGRGGRGRAQLGERGHGQPEGGPDNDYRGPHGHVFGGYNQRPWH